MGKKNSVAVLIINYRISYLDKSHSANWMTEKSKKREFMS